MSKLIEGFRHMLCTGSGSTRSHLSKGFFNRVKNRHICKVCAKARVTRRFFSAKPIEVLQGLKFLEKVAVDVSV